MANDTNLGFEHRWSFAGTRLECVSSTFGKNSEILDSMGLLGTRTRREDRSRAGLIRFAGNFVFDITPRHLDVLLPFVLGASESTDTFAAADALTGMTVIHDYFGTGSNAMQYNEVYVNRMSLRFGPGILRMTLDCVGKTVTTGQTFSGSLGSTAGADTPYVFHDTASGITLKGSAIEIEEGELVVDNALDVKFRNSQTATSIRATERIVSFVSNLPLTSSTLSTYYGDKAAADATVVITNGTVTTTFTLYNLKNPDEGPQVGGKGEVPLILRSAARGDASDPDISVTVTGASL